MDPSLVSNVLGLLGGGSESGSFDIGSLISIAQMLTQGGKNLDAEIYSYNVSKASYSNICFFLRIHNFHPIITKLYQNKLLLSIEFRYDWVKIVDSHFVIT